MTATNTDDRRTKRLPPCAAALLAAALILSAPGEPAFGQTLSEGESLLKILGFAASEESVDYVVRKTPFQLHTLLTEARHPKTMSLGERIAADTEAGVRMLLSVDDDIAARLASLLREPADGERLERLVAGMEAAILARRKIYVYGCGATGRLAKQIESSFWRPFWQSVRGSAGLWAKLEGRLDPAIVDGLVGEMTGADRALISSLEGFEDLPLIGRLQLRDRGILKGDLVVCVTEGGETSSVIGTILAAHDDWVRAPGYDSAESRRRLFFIYNNPDDRLHPFERSRRVLDEPGITKINLTTGPQAITGSTRMQATTIETFVVGSALETAVERVLRRFLSKKEMTGLGFDEETTLEARLSAFPALLQEIKRKTADIARLTDLETKAYAAGRYSTYFAKDGLITVFIDSTERSPTFRLYPLDTVKEPARKCWIQVWTAAFDPQTAWQTFLGRPFRGLSPDIYRSPFEGEIDDPYLKDKALLSLDRAGDDQAGLYDFSFSADQVRRRGPKTGDVGIIALIGREAGEELAASPVFRRFHDLTIGAGAGLGIIAILDEPEKGLPPSSPAGRLAGPKSGPSASTVEVALAVSPRNDPFRVRHQMALKMILNAHSTAVMAKLGKVVGNTMTNVSPSNLKLIGRATHLIQLHVNDVLARPGWARRFGARRPISYAEANAVLYDAVAFMNDRAQAVGQAAEVPLSIIRILEALQRREAVPPEEALDILRRRGLAAYLGSF